MSFNLILKTILFLFVSSGMYAQSVGINTSYPDPSAILDVRSTNKGLLAPRVSLTGISDNTTIVSPATSLLVYNTNEGMPSGKGFYYNNGSSGAPSWLSLRSSAFTIPFYEAIDTTVDALAIKNSGTGNALLVDGKIRIINTFESPGRFLMTSWPDGEVNWEGGIAFSAHTIGSNDIAVPNNTDKKIPFYAESYDMGNDFTLSFSIINPGTFIVPRSGLYHFDATILWNGFSGNSNSDFGGLTIWINNVAYLGHRQNAGTTTFSNTLSTDIALIAGDTVHLTVYQNSNATQTISNIIAANRFSGRFISTM